MKNLSELSGAGGVGKTTMLFQRLTELNSLDKKSTLHKPRLSVLSSFDLSEFAFEFADSGGEYLLLDEVHKYPEFAPHLKTIYDMSDLKVIFTGSSALALLNAKADLSRRVSIFELKGLSFREFLEISEKKQI